jgi:hypothetical protein
MQPRLAWPGTLCVPGWPRTHDSLASNSWVLGLRSCSTPSFCVDRWVSECVCMWHWELNLGPLTRASCFPFRE